MTINDLINKAAQAYPDKLLLDYWDLEKGQPRENPNAGDTLAYFIVNEIFETFNADASDTGQLTQAVIVLNSAIADIQGVVSALGKERK